MANKTSKKSAKVAKKAAAKRVPAKPTLLAGGNPQIGKADGDAPVQAYIAAMPGWKRDVGRRLDALIVRTVPDVRKAVKWNLPFSSADAAAKRLLSLVALGPFGRRLGGGRRAGGAIGQWIVHIGIAGEDGRERRAGGCFCCGVRYGWLFPRRDPVYWRR